MTMIAQLTRTERLIALVILAVLACVGRHHPS